MILTNLHMVDIPYARKVSCARESKVIEVTGLRKGFGDRLLHLHRRKRTQLRFNLQWLK